MGKTALLSGTMRNGVIRTILISDVNPLHSRIILFDQHAGNIGTLTCRTDDLTDLVHLLKPMYLRKTEGVILPEGWKDPADCQWKS